MNKSRRGASRQVNNPATFDLNRDDLNRAAPIYNISLLIRKALKRLKKVIIIKYIKPGRD